MALSSIFYAACDGKRRMPYHEAVRTARRMRQQRDAKITEYRCSVCEWWHVGNRPEHDGAATRRVEASTGGER